MAPGTKNKFGDPGRTGAPMVEVWRPYGQI